MGRLDEDGSDALVQLREPVNKYPEFVTYAVQRLKTLCPTMGKQKLAQVLARAGLHLGATTVGRMRKEPPKPVTPASGRWAPIRKELVPAGNRSVTAKRPNHVWHIDVAIVPTQLGLWCAWWPFALPQHWAFCWWLALVVDHHSRRIMGFALFRQPTASVDIRAFLGRVIRAAGSVPKYIVSDKGSQFWCTGYKRWCKQHGIRPRFGAIGKHGSIAVIERLIGTIKRECLAGSTIPYRREGMRRVVQLVVGWYNDHRAHTKLNGATPNERYFKRFPANRKPRIEPRAGWPRGSPCALPHSLVAGKPGARFDIEVEHVDGHSQLPIIRLRRAA